MTYVYTTSFAAPQRLELLHQNVTAKYWQLDIAVTLQLLLDQLLLGSKSHFMFLECVDHCGPLWSVRV